VRPNSGRGTPAPDLLTANIGRIDDPRPVPSRGCVSATSNSPPAVPPVLSDSDAQAGLKFDPSRVHVSRDRLVEGAA